MLKVTWQQADVTIGDNSGCYGRNVRYKTPFVTPQTGFRMLLALLHHSSVRSWSHCCCNSTTRTVHKVSVQNTVAGIHLHIITHVDVVADVNGVINCAVNVISVTFVKYFSVLFYTQPPPEMFCKCFRLKPLQKCCKTFSKYFCKCFSMLNTRWR